MQPPSNEERSVKPEVHQGYELEGSLFERVRSWTDLFGFLRLARVLRGALSPPLVLLSAITLAISTLLAASFENHAMPIARWQSGLSQMDVTLGNSLVFLTRLQILPPGVFRGFAVDRLVLRTLELSLQWILWTPLLLILFRQGALLSVGRTMEPIGELIGRTRDRGLAVLAMVGILVGCAGIFLLPCLLSFYVAKFPYLVTPGTLIGLGFLLPATVLLAGAYVSLPIGVASLANEEITDPVDSLSRGFEAVLRRPLTVIGLCLASALLLHIVHCLAAAVSGTAAALVWTLRDHGLASPGSLAISRIVLAWVPCVIGTNLAGLLIGAMYLLIRQSTNEQQPEDLWVPPPKNAIPMPVPKA
ncbi:MAG: hypothetical protein AAF664_14770, partial [Planctomycetota bacterium]